MVNVTPLTAEELEDAAVEPARRVEIPFEPALLGQLLSDVGSQPAALPLFQYTLTELFDRRAGDLLLVSTYRAMGGVQGALRRRAAELHDQLTAEQQDAARQLFLRLVSVTEHDEYTRRRVPASDILALDVDAVTIEEVIAVFGRQRLLAFDADPLTGAPTVEVAHEALLTVWPRLRQWIEDSRDDLRRHASFAVALRERELAGHDADYLLGGARLAEYEQWAETSAMKLTTDERAFVDASTASRDDAARAEARRQRQEAELGRRARRRLWALIASFVVLGGVAVILASAILAGRTRATVAFFGFRADNAFEANIAAGLDRAVRELNIELVEVEPAVDVNRQLRELAATSPDMIVAAEAMFFLAQDVMAEYPDVKFGVIEGTFDAPNATGVSFATEQGAFLAGAAAALKSGAGVGGQRFERLERFRAGFEAGARHVDPDVEILATYIEEPFAGATGFFLEPFNRPDLGRRRAGVLYERADVVFHAASESGFGVFDAAVEQSEGQGRHPWAIGVDNNQWLQATPPQRDHVLTSMIKRADIAAYALVRQLVDGQFEPGLLEMDLSDDVMDFSTRGGGLTDAMIARLNQLKAEIAAGRITVPKRPRGDLLVLDRVPDGFDEAFADLSEREILEYFDRWLFPTYPDPPSTPATAGRCAAAASTCSTTSTSGARRPPTLRRPRRPTRPPRRSVRGLRLGRSCVQPRDTRPCSARSRDRGR